MNRRHRPIRHDRGVALLLVLVAMATATTLTIGWLASQDNANLIGRNVVATAEARSVASSGLDLAISVMQTETQWRTMHQNGVLFRSLPLGDGMIDLALLDPTTNQPPTALINAPFRIGNTPIAARNTVSTIDTILIHQNLTLTRSACISPSKINFPDFSSSEICLFPP